MRDPSGSRRRRARRTRQGDAAYLLDAGNHLEKPSYTLYAMKFTAIQFINLFIVPSWNNVRGVAYLVKATPYLKRLRLEIKSFIAFTVFLKAFGGLLFIISSSFEAFVPHLTVECFNNNLPERFQMWWQIKSVIAFTMFLKAFGGLLFISNNSFGAVVLCVDI
ncbi:hypothetical protein TRIUR3_32197 [Triticum urartu]|uniref:Uncharacterized protein n=1 Tax=Triticum urartu TaxID=4572 RepID=M8ARX7_TRIUA|nr:hypothetical protein TRIUR3_32197 [Triticum urartu]